MDVVPASLSFFFGIFARSAMAVGETAGELRVSRARIRCLCEARGAPRVATVSVRRPTRAGVGAQRELKCEKRGGRRRARLDSVDLELLNTSGIVHHRPYPWHNEALIVGLGGARRRASSTMFTSSKMSMSTASQPKFMTTTMKEKTAERNGARRIIINPKKKSPPKDELVLPGGHEFPYTAGSFYVGEWQGDKKSGFGTQTWTSGDKYEGEWSDGKQQGKGSFWKKENGRLRKRYAGDWVGGQRTGLGVLVYKNGDKYEGEWARNERHGSGNMSYAAGQDTGDSTSLQRECSARARFGNSTHASRALREMIARPKISRNEWKPAEL